MALLLSSCGQAEYITQSRLLMGTTVSISVETNGSVLADKAIAAAFCEIERVEEVMSLFKENSMLNELNKQAAVKPFKISDELFYIIEASQKFSKLTNGAFDVTATSLDKANGYKKIILDKGKKTIYFKDKKIKVDLGGSAKGYAVDRAIAVLSSHGYSNTLVNAGGDIYASGNYRKGKWAIGIRNPLKVDKIEDKIYLTNMAVATSGNYLRVHIIKTIDNDKKFDAVSATVIAPKCLEADILATAVFADPNIVMEVAESLDGIEVLLIKNIDGELKEVKTRGFIKYQVR